jgi:hypothetical protein
MSSVARIWRGTTPHGQTGFVLVSLWDSRAAIERLAGPDVERAVNNPEDDHYLLEREPKVEHWQAELLLPR